MVSTLLDRALAAIAPPACFGCGASAGSAAPLCAACRSGLGWLSPETVLLEAEGELGLEAWAPLAYRGGARALARALKFRGAVALADGMAAPIVAGAPPALLSDSTVIPFRCTRPAGVGVASTRPSGSAGPSGRGPAFRCSTASSAAAAAAPRWAATATSASWRSPERSAFAAVQRFLATPCSSTTS